MTDNDLYASFHELTAHENPRNYHIDYLERNSEMVILAIHGGGIETGTSELARGIAGEEYSYYLFEGNKVKNNTPSLHITSTHFDEENCVRLVSKSNIALSIHGMKGSGNKTFVGGRNTLLKKQITETLNYAGFPAKIVPDNHRLSGLQKENICNRTKKGMGVQLEIEAGLRKSFFRINNKVMRGSTQKPDFFIYINAIRSVLSVWEKEC